MSFMLVKKIRASSAVELQAAVEGWLSTTTMYLASSEDYSADHATRSLGTYEMTLKLSLEPRSTSDNHPRFDGSER